MDKYICVYEPRGDHGLEGYRLNTVYEAEELDKDGKTFFKIRLDDNEVNIRTKNIFRKYFDPIDLCSFCDNTKSIKYGNEQVNCVRCFDRTLYKHDQLSRYV